MLDEEAFSEFVFMARKANTAEKVAAVLAIVDQHEGST